MSHLYVSLASSNLDTARVTPTNSSSSGSSNNMQLKRRTNYMDGVYVSVSPMFVKDIKTVEIGGSGNIVSLLEPKKNSFDAGVSTFDPNFNLNVRTNPKFVAKIQYPTQAQTSGESFFQHNRSVGESLTAVVGAFNNDRVPRHDPLDRDEEMNSLDDDIDEMFDMDGKSGGGSGSSPGGGQMESSVLDAAANEARMSFDDLGQIYTNISRKRILSKVRWRIRNE